MFEWDDLKHFLAVARHGSTLAAAKALALSQSTVHRRIEELERQLGRQLVVRHASGYKLTEVGRDMVAYAAHVEDAALEFERRLAASDLGLAGTVRMTCPIAAGARLMRSPLMAKFNARYPNVRVEFVLNDKLFDLSKGEADIAIRSTAPYDDALFGRKIADSPWAIYASRAYVERHGGVEDVSVLGRHAVALLDGDSRQHATKGWLEKVAPAARVAARCNSMAALVSAARSGVGLVALPMIVADGEQGLVLVYGPVRDLTTNFYLLIHRDLRRTPRIRALFDFLVENAPAIRALLRGEERRPPRRSQSRRRRKARRNAFSAFSE